VAKDNIRHEQGKDHAYDRGIQDQDVGRDKDSVGLDKQGLVQDVGLDKQGLVQDVDLDKQGLVQDVDLDKQDLVQDVGLDKRDLVQDVDLELDLVQDADLGPVRDHRQQDRIPLRFQFL